MLSSVFESQMRYPGLDARNSARIAKSQRIIFESDSSSSLPNIFKDQHQLKGFYRVNNNPSVSPEVIVSSYVKGLTSHYNSIAQEAKPEYMILYQDTTFCKYPGRSLDIGYLETGKDNGLALHSGVLTTIDFVPVGVPCQEFIIRDRAEHGKRATRKSRSFEDKESFKWTNGFDFARKFGRNTGIKVINVFDKEGDVGDLFNYAIKHNLHFVANARHDRMLKDQEVRMQDYLDSLAVSEIVKREILDQKGVKHLKACEVKFAPVELKDINKTLYVIELKQVEPIDGQEPAHWILLTTLHVKNTSVAEQMIDIYAHRWPTCEDYHKCLKTGCSIESREPKSIEALTNLITILSLVAVALLHFRHLSETNSDAQIQEHLTEEEWEVALKLGKKYLKPKDYQQCREGSSAWFVLLLARMGGWLNFNQKGKPGWQTIWKGWRFYQNVVDGFVMSKN